MDSFFTFIIDPIHGNPNRKGETLSLINSHVASVVHARRKPLLRHQSDQKRKRPKPVFPGLKRHWSADDTNRNQEATVIHSVPSASDEIHSMDHQLTSILDPFLHLPIKLSRDEMAMLQFILVDGRKLAFGTASQPVYCRAFFSASELRSESTIHVLVHRLIAESVLRRPEEYSQSFYLRRAQAYRAMNDLLTNIETSFQEKILGFIILSILELALKRPDLQFKHTQAMLRHIDEEGGTCFLLNLDLRLRPTCNMPWLLGFMMYDGSLLNSKKALEEVTNRFIQAITDIKIWTAYVKIRWYELLTEDSKLHQHFSKVCKESEDFPRIRAYIDHVLTNILGRRRTDHLWVTPIFFFFFALCIPQAVYDYDIVTSLHFLKLIEDYINRSASFHQEDALEVAVGICWLSSQSNPPMLHAVRRNIHPLDDENEAKILQSAIDVLKVIPLLSLSSRRELARSLGVCALAVVEPSNATSCFGQKWIKGRIAEIEYNWYLGKANATPMDA